MTFDDKMDLLDDALDNIRKVQDTLAKEGAMIDANRAETICHKILDLQVSIMADEHYRES